MLLSMNVDGKAYRTVWSDAESPNFSVKIISIKQKEIPELNDEFVKSLGQEDIKTIETLNSRIKLNL